jgi:hypothetical protein
LVFLIGFTACEDGFRELNVDPDDPTETSVNFLFNKVVQSLVMEGNEKLYLNGQKVYQWSQLAASTDEEPNEINALGRGPVWDNYYNALRNIREIYKRIEEYPGDAERMRNRKAIIDIVYAYKTLRVTDVYGDIPYTQAGQGLNTTEQIFRPGYDTQESVYKDALARLKSASASLVLDDSKTPNGETYFNYGNTETLFKNDMQKWKKLANALQLRYALRMSNVDEAGAKAIISDVMGQGLNNLPESHDDMFAFGNNYNNIGPGIYWAFQFYFGVRMGENVWSKMSADNNPDGSGIYDPRAYVYFETNINGEWVACPQNPMDQMNRDGEPYNDKRRGNTEDTDGEFKGTYSAFNFYMVENDDNGVEFHVAFPEVCFLIAEVYQRGWASGDAQAWYEKGVRASVEKWYTYGAPTHTDWPGTYSMPDEAAMDAFMANENIAYNAATGLQQIYTQRFLDLMLQPKEAWHLSKRTSAIDLLPVQDAVSGANSPMPRRLEYPEDERNNNIENYNAQVGKMTGGDDLMTKNWWDVK